MIASDRESLRLPSTPATPRRSLTPAAKRPIANLLAAKKLKTTGQKRGMEYFTK